MKRVRQHAEIIYTGAHTRQEENLSLNRAALTSGATPLFWVGRMDIVTSYARPEHYCEYATSEESGSHTLRNLQLSLWEVDW